MVWHGAVLFKDIQFVALWQAKFYNDFFWNCNFTRMCKGKTSGVPIGKESEPVNGARKFIYGFWVICYTSIKWSLILYFKIYRSEMNE